MEEYEQLLAKAKNRCEICGNPETQKHRKRLGLDHNHKTKKIRGVLCASCNTMIGYAKDNPILLEAAAQYLRTKD